MLHSRCPRQSALHRSGPTTSCRTPQAIVLANKAVFQVCMQLMVTCMQRARAGGLRMRAGTGRGGGMLLLRSRADPRVRAHMVLCAV